MPHPSVHPDVFRLLLTVARIVRAKISDEIAAEDDIAALVLLGHDLAALNEALAPFDLVPNAPITNLEKP
jgi:hypothetical protein